MRIELRSLSELHAVGTRRDFLRLVGAGGALVLLPGVFSACGSDAATITGTGSPGTGQPLVIDFATGDAAIVQLAYVLQQLEADFYSRVVAGFGSSNITATEQTLLTDIRNHEVMHRTLLESTLGAGSDLKITPTYKGVTLTDRAAVFAFAKSVEELSIAAHHGAARYLQSTDTLTLLAKIAAVDGRHASAIGDLLAPLTEGFAPTPTDKVLAPAKVGPALQANLVDKLGFANLPTTTVPGSTGNV